MLAMEEEAAAMQQINSLVELPFVPAEKAQQTQTRVPAASAQGATVGEEEAEAARPVKRIRIVGAGL